MNIYRVSNNIILSKTLRQKMLERIQTYCTFKTFQIFALRDYDSQPIAFKRFRISSGVIEESDTIKAAKS